MVALRKTWPHGSDVHRAEYYWDDLRAEPTIRTTGAATWNPAREEWFDSTGLNVGTAGQGDIHLFSFDDSSNEKEVRFQFQMPHAWDGTPLHPHVHWVGNTAAATAEVRWGLQYTWAGIGSIFPPTITVYGEIPKIGLGGTETGIVAGRHYMTLFPLLEPNTNQDGVSSVLLCRIFRNSTASADTYTSGKAGLLYFDIHYRIDYRRPGTRGVYRR